MGHKHKDGHECEICRDGLEAVQQKETAMIQEHGWFVHFVPGSDVPYGLNIHTHGLFEVLDHLDLQICLSMDPQTAHNILGEVIEDHIKKGEKLVAGEKYEKIIGNGYKVLFLNAKEGDRNVLRLIFPDKDGGFDGVMSKQLEGCDIPEGLKLSA